MRSQTERVWGVYTQSFWLYRQSVSDSFVLSPERNTDEWRERWMDCVCQGYLRNEQLSQTLSSKATCRLDTGSVSKLSICLGCGVEACEGLGHCNCDEGLYKLT